MKSETASIYKILNDKTRQKIILSLTQKSPLSYSELMEDTGLLVTGLFNYHLGKLKDFIAKGENGKYALTEKGVMASKLLSEFPDENFVHQGESKTWRSLWIIILSIGLTNSTIFFYLGIIRLEYFIAGLFLTPLFTTIGYYSKRRWSLKMNRAFYIIFGVGFIGGIIYFIGWYGMIQFIFPRAGEDFVFVMLISVVSLCIGGLIGEAIGKMRDYKIPN